MILECAVIVAVLIGGASLLRRLGLDGWALLPLGFVAGTCLYLILAAALALFRITTRPQLALLLTALVPLLVYAGRARDRIELLVRPLPLVVSLVGVAATVGFFRWANLVNYNHDSFEYLAIGSMLGGGGIDHVNMFILQQRGLAVPYLHAPASLVQELYVSSFAPLLALAMLASLGWFISRGTRLVVDAATSRWLVAAGVLLVATNNRTVFNAFYLNGHLLVALLILVVCGAGWLIGRSEAQDTAVSRTLQMVALPVLTIVRPETILVAMLAVVPTLVSRGVSRTYRLALVALWTAAGLGWQGFVLMQGTRLDLPVHFSVGVYLLLIPLLACFLAAIVWYSERSWLLAHSPRLIEIVALLTLIPAYLLAPDIIGGSVESTMRNIFLGETLWGPSMVILVVLVGASLVFARSSGQDHLRLVLTTFFPLALLIAVARGGPYRIAHADSLNRMVFHIVPLAALYLSASAAWLINKASERRLQHADPASLPGR